MIQYKEEFLKFKQQIGDDLDTNDLEQSDSYQINQEYILFLWDETIQQFDECDKETDLSLVIKTINRLTLILEEFYSQIIDYNQLLICIENSQFFKYIQSFLLSINAKMKSSILIFLICFSMLTSDFMDIIIQFITSDIISYYLFPKNNSAKIISFFFTLIGLISEYSAIFAKFLLDNRIIEISFQLFQNIERLTKIQILNFTNRITQNYSSLINIDEYCESFHILINHLIDYFVFLITETTYDFHDNESILFVLNIFKNIYLIPNSNNIILEHNITQFILDFMGLVLDDNKLFIEMFPIEIKIIDIGFDHIQIDQNKEKIGFLCEEIKYYLNISLFLDKINVMKNVISIIFKCNVAFKEIFIGLGLDLMIFVNSEVNFRDDVILCLQTLGFNDEDIHSLD